jgi:subtilisin family serine protease
MSMLRILGVTLILLLALATPPGFTVETPTEPSRVEPLLLFEASRSPPGRALDVYVLLSQPPTDGLLSELARLGTIRARTDIVVTLRLARESLEELARLPFVQRVGGGRTYRITLDESIPEMGVDVVWRELRDGAGNRVLGAGVTIGIVDTGIDVRHPDFYFENGTSKILFVWDQTAQGRPPAGFPYGAEWTRRDIELGVAATGDTHGHGTHVAGIAASTGRASGKWMGVAPAAGLIIVKSGRPVCRGSGWSFGDTELIDALTYIWQKSKSAGLRTVINLSLGGNLGGHDDTDPLEKLLNRIVADGIPVVVAAGNSGDRDIHAGGWLAQGGSATVPWVLDRDVRRAIVDVWHGLGDRLDILVTAPDGTRVLGPTPPTGVSTGSGRISIGRFVGEKGVNWQIEVTSAQPLRTSGWSFTLLGVDVRGDGRWDAYIDTDSCEDIRTGFTSYVERSGTVGVPATASGVIAVGAYVTRERIITGFTPLLGPPGSLATFSSRGPTRDGRVKPDVAAPGADIVSALSSQAGPVRRYTAFGGDATHVPLRGTSMAAPHVAGLAALLMQYEANLTPERLMERLRRGARQDGFTGPIDPSVGSNLWGWGKADARGATSAFYAVALEFRGLPRGIRFNVTVDGSIREAVSDLVVRLWFLLGTTHRVSVPAIIQPSPEVRYRADRTAFEVSAPGVFTITYSPQYLLIVRVGHLPEERRWFDEGSMVTLGPPDVPAPADGARLLFKGWVVDGTPPPNPEVRLIMDRPRVVEAVYIKQYFLNITSDAQEPDGEGWYDEGSLVVLQALETIQKGPGERMVFSHWLLDGVQARGSQLTVAMTGPRWVHAAYKRQFLLTIVTQKGTVTGGGWYDEGGEASFSITPLRLGFPVQDVFVGWRGDFTGPSPSGRVIMDGPKMLEAVWAPDYSPLYALLGLLIALATLGGLLVRGRGASRHRPASKH